MSNLDFTQLYARLNKTKKEDELEMRLNMKFGELKHWKTSIFKPWLGEQVFINDNDYFLHFYLANSRTDAVISFFLCVSTMEEEETIGEIAYLYLSPQIPCVDLLPGADDQAFAPHRSSSQTSDVDYTKPFVFDFLEEKPYELFPEFLFDFFAKTMREVYELPDCVEVSDSIECKGGKGKAISLLSLAQWFESKSRLLRPQQVDSLVGLCQLIAYIANHFFSIKPHFVYPVPEYISVVNRQEELLKKLLGNEPKMTRLSITVPTDLDEFIREYSKKQRRSVSAQIQLLIEELQNKDKSK